VTSRVLLVGMMGCGKSTVGSALARRLGWVYLDSDAEVERLTGHSVPEIFAIKGEAAFRAEEAKVLAQAVTTDTPTVVSVAGGAVLDPENRRRLKRAGLIVWLRARPETLAERVGDGRGRPLLGNDPLEALKRLDAVRRPVYAELAQVTVDVDGIGAPEVVELVLPHVEALTRGTAGGAVDPPGRRRATGRA
jgi:shikimate kinase